MRAEKQIDNNKYNIIKFIKYLSEVEQNNNIIAFINNESEIEKINENMKKNIEFHTMFNNIKFDIWLLKNKKKVKKSIIFVSLNKLNKLNINHINKLNKQCNQLIIEFSQNIKIEEARKISKNALIGYTNYDTKEIRKVFMLLGKKFEYKKQEKQVKVLAIIHAYNEEDVIDKTVEHLLEQNLDILVLDNWSTDNTYKKVEKLKNKYPNRIMLSKYPDNKPKENIYDWTKQLHKTEQISKELDYDWYVHYDADEIRISPFKNTTLSEMISFVDSLGYNAIDTTVIDFRMTKKDDNTFGKNGYFEIGRKPSHFSQIKTWKKCNDIDLANSAGHLAIFKDQKVYPLKILNKHYPLRSFEQAKRKIFKDRLPRFEKEKNEKGWHRQYDKIVKDEDLIYDEANLNKFDENTMEKLGLELIAGIGIRRL